MSLRISARPDVAALPAASSTPPSGPADVKHEMAYPFTTELPLHDPSYAPAMEAFYKRLRRSTREHAERRAERCG
jgi:hypothetical protein